jgi:protein-S-isoprenylcysteine O-methyltransferase Ste14
MDLKERLLEDGEDNIMRSFIYINNRQVMVAWKLFLRNIICPVLLQPLP